MVNLATSTISLGSVIEPIKQFDCWFRTPMGLHSTLDDAKKTCEENEWEINAVIVPIPMAIGSTLYEELR